MPAYDRCGEILRKLIEDCSSKKNKKLSAKWIAQQSKVNLHQIRACIRGDRFLHDKDANRVADCLGLSEAQKKNFVDETAVAGAAALNAAKAAKKGEKTVKSARLDREPAFRDRLADPNFRLVVENLPYLPFSSEHPEHPQFVDLFLDRFFQLSGIQKVPAVGGSIVSGRATRLLNRESDIAVNLFCTLPRLKKLDFLLFPIRLSISAVMPVRFRKRREGVQETLLGKNTADSQLIRLIVVQGEVGHEHATTVMRRSDADLEILHEWKAEDYAEKLTGLDEKCEGINGTIPVLLCDEMICLRVLRVLAERGRARDYALVFPPSTKQNIRRFDNRRETPEYRLGLAVSGKEKELWEYLRQSLQFYLLTDPEYLARLYAGLFEALVKYVLEAIKGQDIRWQEQPLQPSATPIEYERHARDFARYALRLDREGVENYRDQYLPWRNILRRAYQIVCVAQASERLGIRRLVEHTLRQRLGTDFDRQEIKEWRLVEKLLQEEFDVPLHLANKSIKSLEGIVSQVQTALLTSATGTDLEFSIIDAEPEHRKHVQGLFAQFVSEMQGKGIDAGPVPTAEDIVVLIPESSDPKPSTVVLLAVRYGRFIGCVQVGPLLEDGAARLTRLLVIGDRRQGVGASLVWAAIERAAEKLNASKVFIKENQTPAWLAYIFKKKGFLPDASDVLYYPVGEAPVDPPEDGNASVSSAGR